MKRLLAVLAAALALVVSAQPAATAAPHTGPSWSWNGPAAWTATYGTFGLTVTGTSSATFDLGFGTAICSLGSTNQRSVVAWFKAKRTQLKDSGWRLTAGEIRQPSGFPTTYRRQVLEGTITSGGTRYTGELILDYDFLTNTSGTNYCYQRSVAKYATRAAWETRRPQLDAIQGSLDYTGPGAPAGHDPAQF